MLDLLHRLLDPVTAQQDYAWFLAWLAWLGATVCFFVERRKLRALPDWLRVAAAAQVTIATLAILQHASPPADPFVAARVWGLLTFDFTVAQCAAVVWAGCGGRRSWLTLLGLSALLAGVALEATRAIEPGEPENVTGMLIVLGTATLAGVAAARRASRSWKYLLGLLWLGMVLAPNGPLAAALSEARHWVDLTVLSVPAALVTAAAGVLALIEAPRAASSPLWEPATGRRLAARVGLCLLIALLFAAWMGQKARRNFEASILARARAFAAVVDTTTLTRWLDLRFELGELITNRTHFGGVVELYRTPAVKDPAIAPLRAFIGKLQESNPDLRYVHIATLRKGDLVEAVSAADVSGPNAVVARQRLAETRDRQAWEDRQAYFSPPFMSSWGALVRAWAPLVGPEKQMLGWLVLDAGVPNWTAAQAQARLQSFALAALAIVLLVMAEFQRQRAAEHAATQAEARAARVAAEAKSTFLAQVSHELRTPLQSILGFGALVQGTALDSKQARWMERLSAQSTLLLRLVDDLLDITAHQVGAFRLKPTRGDLATVVAETVESFRPRAEARRLHLTLAMVVPSELPLVFDADRMKQVVHNLVGNAVKFTEKGGVDVTLTITRAGKAADCELRVRDTGPGISVEGRPRLFRPFERLEETAAKEGTGLGLSLSRSICRALDGDVTITNSDGTGSEFRAHWTVDCAESDSPRQNERLETNQCLAGMRVLVVDDNAFVRELFVEVLRTQGAEVDTAADGEEALVRCRDTRYGTLLLDLSMPRMDGFQVSEHLRSTGYATRIVGVSAHAGKEEQARARRMGMDAFLTKPVAFSDLLAIVQPQKTTTDTREPEALLRLRARLRQQFALEIRDQLDRLAESCRTAQWPMAARQAHYIKNSADVIQLTELSHACTRFELQANRGDAAAFDTLQRLEEVALTFAP